jgi:hypothetical protein
LILSGEYNPTAALFPRWVAAGTVIFLVFIVGARFFGKPQPRVQEPDEEFTQPAPDAAFWPAVLALQGGYILAIYLLGFTVATLLYLLSAPLQMHYRRWGVIGVHAVLLTVVISGSFIWIFHIRLPTGILWSLG